MNKKLAFLVLFAMVGAFAFGAKDAHASSIFDGRVTTYSNPELGNDNCSNTDFKVHDVTTTWATDFRDASGTDPGTFDLINDHPDDYYWALLQQRDNSGSRILTLIATKVGTSGLSFVNNPPQVGDGKMYAKFASGFSSGDYSIDSIRTPNGTSSCSNYQHTGDADMSSCYPDGWCFFLDNSVLPGSVRGYNGIVFANMPFTPPSGYEGPEIPETLVPPVEPSSEVPNMQLLNVVDFKGIFSDSRFATFDDAPFLCSGDLAPALHYEIYSENGTETLLTSGVMSATGQLEYQFTRADTDRDYRILGYYDCGDSPDDPIFDESSYTDFTITRGGLIESTIFEDCMNADFPFIHFDECIANLYTVLNLISFNTIGFNNSWNSAEGCYNLVVLDDWLHIDNPTVCPEVPSFVRSIVTPFVTLLLGLVTITFLARNRGSNW